MNFFPRQWFAKDWQYGLSSEAILYDSYLKQQNFVSAINHLKSYRSLNKDYWERRFGQLKKVLEFVSKSEPVVHVNFIGFWPSFDIRNNQFLDLLNIVFPRYSFVGCENQQISLITFFSCYGDITNLTHEFHSIRILYLAENVRPMFSLFDYSLTSDIWNYADRNIYYPPWMLEIDWEGTGKIFADRKPVNLSELEQSQVINFKDRVSKVVYIGNNAEPFRESIITSLRSFGIDVDIFGSQANPVDNKQKKLSEYKVTLCPENSLFEGYVTEKPIHSYLANTVGIYRGGYIPSHLQLYKNPMFIMPSMENNYNLDDIVKKTCLILEADKIKSEPLIDQPSAMLLYNGLKLQIKKTLGWIFM